MNIQIREAVESDYPYICSLINNELGYPEVELSKLASRMKIMRGDNNYHIFTALLNDKTVGFIGTFHGVTFELDSRFMRILAFAVSKGHQNKGIGGLLLKHAEKYAGSMGVTSFVLSSKFKRLDAHTFYEHNGYIKKSYGFSKNIEHTV